MNKIGGDRLVSMYWFAILFIVAAAIVYMTMVYYGKPYDIREIEGNLLANKVVDCLVPQNYLDESVSHENFLEVCRINFENEEFGKWDSDQYYVDVSPIGIRAGNTNLLDFCSEELGKNPYCIRRSFYSITSTGEQKFIDVRVAVRKTEKNVRN